MRPRRTKERDAFLQALQMWDRPDKELFGRPLEDDADTDSFIDRAFSAPSGGVLRD